MANKADENAQIYLQAHYDNLAQIANACLRSDVDLRDLLYSPASDTYTVDVGTSFMTSVSSERLAEILKENINIVLEHPEEAIMSFTKHLKEINPEIKTKGMERVIEDDPSGFIALLSDLARNKTFRGTCPVCRQWQ